MSESSPEDTVTVDLRFDAEITDSVRALLFGELVKRATGVKHYHSDLYHDALWVHTHVTGPTEFDFVVRESGTQIGTEAWANVQEARIEMLAAYRVKLERSEREKWTATFARLDVETEGNGPTRTTAALADEMISRLDDKYELVFVERDDKLTDEQVGFLVADDFEKLWESMADWEGDSRDSSIDQIMEQLLDDVISDWEIEDEVDSHADLRQEFERSADDERVRDEIRERDESDHVRALASGTGRVLLRVFAIGEDDSWSFEVVTPQMVLERIGFESTEHNVRTLQYVLDNESPEFSVTMGAWVWAADVESFLDLGTERVQVTNPHLWLGNPFTGGGFLSEEPLHGVVTLKRSDLKTDDAAWGWSMEKIHGGLTLSMFEAEMATVPDEKIDAEVDSQA